MYLQCYTAATHVGLTWHYRSRKYMFTMLQKCITWMIYLFSEWNSILSCIGIRVFLQIILRGVLLKYKVHVLRREMRCEKGFPCKLHWVYNCILFYMSRSRKNATKLLLLTIKFYLCSQYGCWYTVMPMLSVLHSLYFSTFLNLFLYIWHFNTKKENSWADDKSLNQHKFHYCKFIEINFSYVNLINIKPGTTLLKSNLKFPEIGNIRLSSSPPSLLKM